MLASVLILRIRSQVFSGVKRGMVVLAHRPVRGDI